MSKFKVGDRVKVIDAESVCAPGRLDGRVGTVTKVVGRGDEVSYYVSCDGEPDSWCFGEANLRHHCDLTTLTRRDHFAMAALTGILGGGEVEYYPSLAEQCYKIADAMELARNKEGGE